jgi:tRNA nucleotidyltransferase (CCA-adding enzyme)
MGFKMEARTQEWFELAMERRLNVNIESADVGDEIRSLAREDNPAAALKQWEARDLLTAVHPSLQRRKPGYEKLQKLARVRANYFAAGLRPRLHVAVTSYILGRLKSRESAAALRKMEFRQAELDAIARLLPEAQKTVKVLKSRKTNAPRDAYFYLASLPSEMLAYIEVELRNPRAISKIHSYIQKWRPLRLALPGAELDALGIPRGPKFDKILEQLFEMQLRGRARNPEDRTKALRSLAGIKEEPPKKPEKKRKVKEAASKALGAKQREKHAAKAASPETPAAVKPPNAEAKPRPAAPAAAKAPAKTAHAVKRVAGKRSRVARPKPKARVAKRSRRR